MNIFIDTNVYLSFYDLTKDDLEELRKLSVLLQEGEVVLFLPDQVRDEYWRNRETKITAALARLTEQKLNLQFPALCKDYYEYAELRELQKRYEEKHNTLVSNISKDIASNSLIADQVIQELFVQSKRIETNETLLNRASTRVNVGNPPGKKGALGDAVNWEALLANVPDLETLYLVTDDRDYFSPLDEHSPKEFLVREWDDKKAAQIVFYRRMSLLFKERYPHIKLASDLEKELAINKLVSSNSFEATHNAIAELLNFDDYSASHVRQIVRAALSNQQVNWIIGDSDVFGFLANLVNNYRDKIPEESLADLEEEMLASVPREDEDEPPF